MNETTNNCRASRAHNPFDDGARERLRRMELLTETGSIKASALIALAHTFAGLLFDDLCDASQDYSGVQTELQQLFDAVDRAEPRQKFLLLCLQYDRLCQAVLFVRNLSRQVLFCADTVQRALRHTRFPQISRGLSTGYPRRSC
mgnify:CR=1 FL=1